jgi:NADPH-dependent glutamate synthase beta chain and related oxidoreductases
MIEMTPTVAIIGSGPSGCYCAQFLRKSLPVAEITVFEALPVPYGLLRYGVAADHQGTKAVSAQFERMFTRNNVRFARECLHWK